MRKSGLNRVNQPHFSYLGIEIINILEDSDKDKTLTFADIAARILHKVNREIELNKLSNFPFSVNAKSAKETIDNMPIINDPVITKALKDYQV